MAKVAVLAIPALLHLLLAGTEGAARPVEHRQCSMELYTRADASLPGASSSWRKLLDHHAAFAVCDDGALAEGYSDAVTSKLASHWDQLELFAALSRTHPEFRRWAIRHIDATASIDDLKNIMRNADRCAGDAKLQPLCKEIRRAAAKALAEAN